MELSTIQSNLISLVGTIASLAVGFGLFSQTTEQIVISSAALLLAACGTKAPPIGAAVDTAKIVDAIKADEVHWNTDYKSGDAAAVTAHTAQLETAVAQAEAAAPTTEKALVDELNAGQF